MKLFTQHILKTGMVFIVSICFITCGNGKAGKTTDMPGGEKASVIKELIFDKLVALWQSENGKSFEQWTKNENGTYSSRVFSVKGADTSWNEQASIYPENDKWVFENTVKNQNNGKSVKFISTILNDKTVQFSNPNHDFPTDVNYTVADANTVNAFIIGPNSKGGKDTIPFNYTRVK